MIWMKSVSNAILHYTRTPSLILAVIFLIIAAVTIGLAIWEIRHDPK